MGHRPLAGGAHKPLSACPDRWCTAHSVDAAPVRTCGTGQGLRPGADEALLNRAYVYTVQKHGTQKRASGDPYFSHPIEVAGLMTDLKLDQETIVTALLHDTVEDTLATIEDIEKNFGPDIAKLVDGVTKLSKIEQLPENERAAENLRKFLLAMSEDIRVLLVKLADRLHNMRTLHFIKSPEKRRRIARETMDIYAPLAERVGMYEYMREMQLLAFEQLEPEAYATITGRLEQIRSSENGQVDAIALDIKQALAAAGSRPRCGAARSTRSRSGRRWPSATSASSRSPTSSPSAC
jgi:GTP pyrophosphokinase